MGNSNSNEYIAYQFHTNDGYYYKLDINVKKYKYNNEIFRQMLSHNKSIWAVTIKCNNLDALRCIIILLYEYTSLSALTINFSELTILPKELFELTNLELLDISHNNLTILPNEINNLVNLKQLNISHNNLITLPKAIIKLNLKEISYGNNNFNINNEQIFDIIKILMLNGVITISELNEFTNASRYWLWFIFLTIITKNEYYK